MSSMVVSCLIPFCETFGQIPKPSMQFYFGSNLFFPLLNLKAKNLLRHDRETIRRPRQTFDTRSEKKMRYFDKLPSA